eukprot:68699-Rhodomonas_salina.1
MFGGTTFEKKTTAHMRQFYETRLVGVLDDCDHPLPGKAAEMGWMETEYYGCRLLKNAFWDFRLFDVYSKCFPDSLHMADS